MDPRYLPSGAPFLVQVSQTIAVLPALPLEQIMPRESRRNLLQKLLAILCVALAAAATGVPRAVAATNAVEVAAHPDPLSALMSPDPSLAANKRLVFDMWRTVVDAGHIEAADHMLAEGYIQHSPVLRTGRKAFKEIFSVVPRRDIPQTVEPPLVASIAEGNLVVMSLLERIPAHDALPAYTTTHFNLFRVDHGLLAEHWHSVQTAPGPDVPLPGEGGPQPVRGAAGAAQRPLLDALTSRLRKNKRLVFDLWREVEAGQGQRAQSLMAADFIEHSPNAAAGLSGSSRPLEQWLRAPVVAIVAEGNLVALVTMEEHPHPSRAGRTYTTTRFNMYRIVDERIVEHWDAATR